MQLFDSYILIDITFCRLYWLQFKSSLILQQACLGSNIKNDQFFNKLFFDQTLKNS